MDLLQVFEPASVQLQPNSIELLLHRNQKFTKQMQQRTAQAQANFQQIQQQCQKLRRQAQQLQILECINKGIRKQVSLNDILQTTANQLQKALEASRCLIFWPDCRIQRVTCQWLESTVQPENLAGIHCNFSEHYHQTLAQGEPVILPPIDATVAPALQQSVDECGIRAILIVPLIGQQSYLGEIALYQCDREREWKPDEAEFVKSIAARCAIAIEQIQLSEQVQAEKRERQRVETSLQQSEAKYRSIFENAIEGIFQSTPAGGYISANPSLAGIYGYHSPAELIANLTDIGRQLYVNPTRRDEFIALIQKHGIVSEFESQIYRADGSIIWISENAHAVRNAEGELLYCEGTVLNISKRKQAELALKEQQEFLRYVIDTNPSLIFVKDWEGKFTLANQALADIYGTTIDNLIGKKDADFNPNHTEVEEFLAADQQVMRTLQPKMIPEETVSSPSGEIRWFQTIKKPILSPDGKAGHILAVCNDITECKQTEKALQASKQMLQLVMDNIPQLIFWKDRNSVYLGCNRNFARVAGVGTPEEIAGKTDYDLAWKKEESDWFRECDARVMATDTPEFHIIETQRQADGKESWADTNKIPLHDSAGNVVGIIGTYEDVTLIKQAEEALQKVNQALEIRVQERTAELSAANEQLRREITEKLQVEEALRESEDRFRNLIETTSDWVWEIDENAVYTYASPKVRDLLGYEPEEVLGKTPFDLMASEEAFRVSTIFGPLVATQQPLVCVENINLHKSRRQVVLETSGAPILDADGVFRGYRGIARDITDRKRAEAALQRQLAAVEAAMDGIAILNSEGQYIYMNAAHVKIFGYDSVSQLAGKTWQELYYPDEIKRFKDNILPELWQKGNWQGEATGKKQNGTTFLADVSLTVIADRGLICVCRDISERKQVEEILKVQERAMAASSNGIAISDARLMDTPLIYVNPAFERMTGYSAAEVIGQNCRFLQGWETDQLGLKQLRRALKEGRECSVVLRNYRKDGSLFWNELNVAPIYDARGNLTHFIGIETDITERKQAEEALQGAKAQLRAVLDAVPGFVSWISSDLQYLGVNRHLAACVNLSPDAFVNQELSFLEGGLEFSEFMREFFAGSKLAANQVIDVQVNGSRRSYLIAAQKYQEGAAAVSVAIDITERQQAQEQLKTSLKEKEVLLKEIHHRVKNNLQIISSLLKLQSSYLKDPEAQALFKDSYNRVRSMALIHEKLYRSSDLAKIDLADYIRNLLGNLFSSYGVSSQSIELKLKVDNIFLDVDTAIPCGLIINELVSNSIKYAFTPDLCGLIFVDFSLTRANEYILQVSDNGIGLPSDFDLEQTDSLGLQLVFNLAEQLGGTLNLNNDCGTAFKIKFRNPLKTGTNND